MRQPDLVGPTEPVTIAEAAKRTDRTRKTIAQIVDDGLVEPKACLLDGRRTLIFELWEVEAALADRRPYRRRVATDAAEQLG